jgi:hypothetical protein
LNIFKSTNKSNTIFFAALLLVGTIAASSPLFMLEAQAEPYYVMDKDRKVVNVSSLKCNNINVNVNGLELDILPPALSTLLTGGEADDNAYSYGCGNGNYGSESSDSENDFRFICINNNNNTVIEAEEPVPPTPTTPPTPPEPQTCEECFTTNLNAIEISRLLSATVSFNTLKQLCDFIDANFPDAAQRQFISSYLLNAALSAGLSTDKINDILDCLEEIYDVVFPRTIDRDSLLLRLTNSNSLDSSIASNLNTDTSAPNINTAGGLVSSFSSSPTIAQGTEEDLSELTATEKITKLKQQWIDLLP